MEEEMSKTHNTKIQNDELERSQSESGLEIHLKEKNKKKIKKCNVVPDHHVNNLRYANPTEISSMTNDLAAFMVRFYCDNHHCKGRVDSEVNLCPLSESSAHRKKIHLDETDSQLSEKYFTLQKALGHVAKVFISQKLVDSKELVSNAAVQSKEFLDALEILSSNRELFVNLIQDPNSLLLKHVRDIQDVLGSEILGEETSTSEQLEESVSNELFQKQRHHKFFRKKDRPKESDSSQGTSKIVVLKPSPAIIENDSVTQILSSSPLLEHSLKQQEEGEGSKSYFSLKGIKQRLRHVMGENRKERHPISMDGVLDRIPYGFKDSGDTRKSVVLASKTSGHSQQTSQPSAVGKKREKSNLKIENPPRDSLFYEEAKKHLTEMVVAARHEKDRSPTVSKSMGRVVSLPEYNLLSPIFSPGNKELVLSPRKIILSPSLQLNRESPTGHLSQLNQSLDQDGETHVPESNQECIAEGFKPKRSMEIVKASDIKPSEQHDDWNVLLESIGDEPCVMCDGCEEEGSSAILELDTADDKPQSVIQYLSIPPSILHIEKLENPCDTLEKPEGPSPVSVLESFFLQDITSPRSTTADHVDLPQQPQQMDFQVHDDDSAGVLNSSDFECKPITCFDEETVHGFVTTLLQASGMSCYRILERDNSPNQLLHPSLLEAAGILHGLLSDDPKLLFDCTNEVLAETQERLLRCTSWVSLIKPSCQVILREEDFIQQVCEGIDRHLQLSEFTLHQITRRDLEDRSWTDLRFEIEAVVIEMVDSILDELIEE